MWTIHGMNAGQTKVDHLCWVRGFVEQCLEDQDHNVCGGFSPSTFPSRSLFLSHLLLISFRSSSFHIAPFHFIALDLSSPERGESAPQILLVDLPLYSPHFLRSDKAWKMLLSVEFSAYRLIHCSRRRGLNSRRKRERVGIRAGVCGKSS